MNRIIMTALLAMACFCVSGKKVVVKHDSHQPPIMGWSSWNTYRVNISDSLIMRQADAMVQKGLKDAGYTYINIDDGYFGGRDQATGRLLIHPTRFPRGLKPVVEHIHQLGLKAGIYSDAGANTCGCWHDNDTIARGVGLYGHDQQDCNMFFHEMGFDFIKIDFCGGRSGSNADRLALEPRERYTAISQAIKNTGRTDVLLNVCRWDYPGTWVKNVATSWRMSRDIACRWPIVKQIIEENLYLSAYAGDGCYNDMDMLEVGRGLTQEEDHTHFAVWCMMSSPLLIGCDLTNLKPETWNLLTDSLLIAINQDPLGLQAYVAKRQGDCYVLVKDVKKMYGKERAVAFVNLSDKEQTLSLDIRQIDLGGDIQFRDLSDSGSQFLRPLGSKRPETEPFNPHLSLFTLKLPAHATRVFTVKGSQRLQRVRYEAETAYLSCYQELYNPQAIGSAYYERDSLCSGGMKAVNLGIRAENDLQWQNVFVSEAGKYRLTVKCGQFPEKASLIVAANGGSGQLFTSSDAVDGAVSLELDLLKGQNIIRLYNDRGRMPEIDYMDINECK